MLDINFVRENVEVIKKAIKDKGLSDSIDVHELIKFDDRRRKLIAHTDEFKQKRNELTDQIKDAGEGYREKLIKEATEIKEEISQLDEELDEVTEKYQELMLALPNITSERMHTGKSDEDNKVIRTVGKPKDFKFEVRDHVELGKMLDIIDVEKSAEISGSRFYYLKNEAVLMQFAISQLVFDTLTSEETLKKIAKKAKLKVSTKPFSPMLPPVLMRKEVMKKMDRLDPEDERYVFDKDNAVFVGSAEHTVGPYHMNEILKEEELPIRYIAYSTAFRREAGSYGKDTHGILRVHQFDKMEMETFTDKDSGQAEQDFIVAIQEYLVSQLDIPYEVMQICTGDTGKPDFNQYDINCWIPSQDKYRETHTSDYMTDFQARRLATRYEDKEGNKHFVHMNDATAFAMSRILIAVIENNQKKDGSVTVPKVLRKYIGKDLLEVKKVD